MRIWIDLTDFLDWEGSLTGIQRVQYNISKLYIKSGRDVHFFVYQEQSRDFREVEFDPEEVVKSGVVSNINKIGKSDRPAFNRRLIQAASRVVPARISRKVRYIYSKNKSQTVAAHPSCVFNSNDVVLIMGGIWVGSFIDDLAICKAQEKFKLIHFAFDMIPSFFPGYVVEWLPDAFTTYKKKVYAISEGILAISESTANDVRKFIKLHNIKHDPKIQVVRIGEGINTGDNATEHSLKDVVGDNFILSVSTIEGRKNHAALFYVLKEAKQRGIDLPKIVIVGRNGWLTDDIRYMMTHDFDARDNIILLNDVDDGGLSWLYKNCLFTVFPSFYEGWGMPVAESLAYGKLCLSSNTSSMPEIAGDLIDYFSPYDTGAMLECVERYLDPQERIEKENRIRHEYKQTSWSCMHRQIDAFVQGIGNKDS